MQPSSLTVIFLFYVVVFAFGCAPGAPPTSNVSTAQKTAGRSTDPGVLTSESRAPNDETLSLPSNGPSDPELFSDLVDTDSLNASGRNLHTTNKGRMTELKIGSRKARVFFPSNYDHHDMWPVVVLLHGYSAGGVLQDLYIGLSRRVDELQIVAVIPDGRQDAAGLRFWNATAACCDIFRSGVDDVGFLVDVLDAVENRFATDPARVYLLGHSNGAFMAHRMICDVPERIAGIIALAGTTHKKATDCKKNTPTTVLQLHGTLDPTILYRGTPLYPSIEETISRSVARNRCQDANPHVTKMDMVRGSDRRETEMTTWSDCSNGTSVALWKMNGEGHLPLFRSNFLTTAIDFLLKHSR